LSKLTTYYEGGGGGEGEEDESHEMPETPNLWRFCTRKAKYLSLRTFAAKKTVNPVLQATI
jgi:hypothetical protein